MDFNVFMEQLGKWQKQPHMFIVNKNRMKEMEEAYDLLEKIVHEYTPDAKMSVNMNVLNDGSAYISTETDELIVHNVQDFISVINKANNFEIYPIKGRKMRISIMFNDVMNVIK